MKPRQHTGCFGATLRKCSFTETVRVGEKNGEPSFVTDDMLLMPDPFPVTPMSASIRVHTGKRSIGAAPGPQ